MFTVYIGIGICIGAVSVIVLMAGFTTSRSCYYVHKKKRRTTEKGLTTVTNPAYGELYANVEFEADPAYANINST